MLAMPRHVLNRRRAAVVGAGVLALAGLGIAPASAQETVTVNVMLQSHTGSTLDIPDHGSASVYTGGWQSIDDLNPNNHDIVRTQLEPGTYTFALTYNGTRDTKRVTISDASNQTVWFHAALVNIELQAHNNSILDLANGSASYYAGGWHAMTDVNVNDPRMRTAEMLPGTYTFAATYNGTRDTKRYTVVEPNPNNHDNARQTVWFHAALVNVAVQAHNNDFLDLADGSASYYAGGWHAMTEVNANDSRLREAEMLPGTYTFAATYKGTRDTKRYTVIEPNPNNHANARQTVWFHAAQVNFEAQEWGNPPRGDILDLRGGSAAYYAGGWHAVTTPNVNNPRILTAEMLPGTYWVAASISNGDRVQKRFTVIEPNPNNHDHAKQIAYFHFNDLD